MTMKVLASELTLAVRGMTCAACVGHVKGALKDLDGVTGAVVNLGLGTARVAYLPGVVSMGALKRAVREVSYEALERSEGVDALDRERQAREDEIRRQPGASGTADGREFSFGHAQHATAQGLQALYPPRRCASPRRPRRAVPAGACGRRRLMPASHR